MYGLLAVAATALIGTAQTQSYQEQYAVDQSRIAQVTYCPLEYVEDRVNQVMSNASVIYAPNKRILAVMGMRPSDPNGTQVLQIAFRGTNGLDVVNWITNLDARLVAYQPTMSFPPGMKVHEGFLTAYQSLAKTIYSLLEGKLIKDKPAIVQVTGHSLGGALASLAAIDLQVRYKQRISVRLLTFGSPRVGNLRFAQFVRSTLKVSYRVTHAHDIVTHVPLQIQGFVHLNSEVWYPSQDYDGKYKECFSQLVGLNPKFLVADEVPPVITDLNLYLSSELLSPIENGSCANSVFPWFNIEQHRYYLGNDITDIKLCNATAQFIIANQ